MVSKIKGENHPRRPSDAPSNPEPDLWAFATKDVTPLPRQKPVSENLSPSGRPPKQVQNKVVFRHMESNNALKENNNVKSLPPDSGHPADERLRRKNITIEARLDLHGHTRDRAHGALIHFVQRCHEQGARCLLVITGKGRGGVEGVLRRHVPEWLGMPPLRDIVLSLHPARPRDGGTGALYVLLRKRK